MADEVAGIAGQSGTIISKLIGAPVGAVLLPENEVVSLVKTALSVLAGLLGIKYNLIVLLLKIPTYFIKTLLKTTGKIGPIIRKPVETVVEFPGKILPKK